jgi:uncharacterized membrane protein YphA (DoxX/SURF4 family)
LAAAPSEPDPRWAAAGAAARVIVGLVFLISGVQKSFAAPEEFAAVIEQYRLLPDNRILMFATVVPWLEVLVGLALVFGYWVRVSTAAGGAFFLMFLGALASTLIRGITLENCGCFGGGIHLTQAQAMGLDSFLLCLSYCAYRFGSAYAPIDAWIGREA